MKAIINNKLYNTNKSKLIYRSVLFGNEIYKTKNENYFKIYVLTGLIKPITLSSVKDELYRDNKVEYVKLFPIDAKENKELKEILGRVDPDKYIEIFGEVEEA